jgi:hypothetical protein
MMKSTKTVDVLTVFGDVLRRRGIAPEAIEAALFAENRRCRPPLPDAEVRTIARTVSRAAPVDESAKVNEVTAEKAVSELERKPDAARTQFPKLIFETLAKVAEQSKREFLAARVARVYRGMISKSKLLEEISFCRLGIEADEAATSQEELRAGLRKIPISPGQLVSDLEHYFAGYLSLPPGAALVLSLWTINTYVFQTFGTTPYLNVRSATRNCGKTSAFELISRVCAKPKLTVNMTVAALFLAVDTYAPTLLMDESEFLQGSGASEIRGLLNAGYKRGATVDRVYSGELRAMRVYCPKAFASIGGLRGTLLDRSITIHMQPGTVPLVKEKELLLITNALLFRLEVYAAQNEDNLQRMQDEEPDLGYWRDIQRREREIWVPLLFHARLAGPEIETRAEALAKRFGQEKRDAQSQDDINVALAREIVCSLDKVNMFEFTSSELVTLVEDEENWGDKLAGRNSKARAGVVGRFLRNFLPTTRLLDGVTRYRRADVLAKLGAHLPSLSPLTPTESTLGGSGEVDSVDVSGLLEERTEVKKASVIPIRKARKS